MKTARLATATALLWLATFGEALAASTTRVYSSGILVLGFIGVCALVVVIQLIPAIMILWGMVKSALESSKKSETAAKN